MTSTPDRLSPSQELLRYFKYDHLPEPLKMTSTHCARLAYTIEGSLPDGPEKTAGLRKLLEAKDCFVRSLLPRHPEVPYIGTPGEGGVPSGWPDSSDMGT